MDTIELESVAVLTHAGPPLPSSASSSLDDPPETTSTAPSSLETTSKCGKKRSLNV